MKGIKTLAILTVCAGMLKAVAHANSLSMSASPGTIPADGSSTSNLTIQAVTDPGSNITSVTASLSVSGPGTVNPTSVVIPITASSSGASGYGSGSSTLTSQTTPGLVTVTASASGFSSGSASVVTQTPAPNSISASANPGSINKHGGTSAITATVNDQFGHLLNGAQVNFSIQSGSGSLNPSSATTGSNGQASSTYSPGGHGTTTIKACAVGGSNPCSTTSVNVQ